MTELSGAPTLRAAGPAEASVVAALEEAGAAFPWTVDAVEGSLALPTTRAWLACDGDAPVGHLLASAAAGVGEVLTLVVHPDCRRRGIGSLLLARCREAWLAEAVTEAFLEVRAGNLGARALYAATGWAEVGRRARYYPDGEDAVVLRWELPC